MAVTYVKLVSLLLICFFLMNVVFTTINASSFNDSYVDLNVAPYEYFTYQRMTEAFIELEKNYSNIMSLSSIGMTCEGRDIWLVKLSDNVEEDEDEPGVLLMGAHHGNEKPSFEVVIFFIQYMVENYGKENTDNDEDGQINEDPIDGNDNDNDGLIDEDPSEDRVREVIDTTQIFLIPMVNPDGVEANTRKNRAPNYGVDLNRNYGYGWYFPYILPEQYHLEWLLEETSQIYRGEKPFSENETCAVKNFVETHNISISLSYHDYGEWMIFPWMHTSMNVPHESLFRSIGYNMSRINNYDLRIYGQYGTQEYIIPRFCGTPGSSENWLYGEHEIIAYTVELCKYRAPRDTIQVLDACWKHVGVNLYICERSLTVENEKEDALESIRYSTIFNFL